ncbi:LacI family DNA-binding transcriptional regulator [Coraliomargarita sp. SDUM461004]|uniref:LacI family DNA-binding transcriptional regulator n=1 Tax=Thalassobacterium sedimentorum TaxID=3041258 RepID=A0ABU1AGY9_9BACT|nr:LacI family DNA-binding transcriptional regulator [Coraliomargarita sp. SDUM461004]MDQ8194055.1 LacI family DNA-binding transcriptional regulator [Coraliomargarita sp. SDUM461004]
MPKNSSSSKPPNKETKPSVYRVADLAGVSPGTVSRVLNNRGRVHEKTRARVLEVARSIGFKPQAQIRTHQIAVVADEQWHSLHNGTYSQALAFRISLALSQRGMAMVTPQNPLKGFENTFLDGVIVLGEYPAFEPIADGLSAHTPVVYIDDFSDKAGRNTVRSDCEMSGRLSAECFLKSGRKRIAFVGSDSKSTLTRLKGFREAIEAAGHKIDQDLVVLGVHQLSFYAAINRVIRLGADSLYVPGSSYEVLEALSVINNVLQLSVPKDIAIIGGEVQGVSEFLTPPMTTIEEPLQPLAEEAVSLLSDLLDKKQKKCDQRTLPVRLVRREST